MPAYSTISSRASVALLLYSLASSNPSIADSRIYVCPNTPVSVTAGESENTLEVCEGAEDALAFFHRLNLEPMRPLVVEIVTNFPIEVSKTAVGCFIEEGERVLVVTFSAFEKRKDWFNIPVDQSMYRSLVTHEVAHAIAYCNFSIPDPTIQAQEYVAYVAMFAMMDSGLRERILTNNPGTGFHSESEINAIVYMFDPMKFGIEAYRHYLQKEHGAAFLLKVLSGDALTGCGMELP